MGYLPDYKRYLTVYFKGYGIFCSPYTSLFYGAGLRDSHTNSSHDATPPPPPQKKKKKKKKKKKTCTAYLNFDVMQSIVACYQDRGL